MVRLGRYCRVSIVVQVKGQGHSYLRVGVADAVVHQHHNENSNGDAKVPNDPAELKVKVKMSELVRVSFVINIKIAKNFHFGVSQLHLFHFFCQSGNRRTKLASFCDFHNALWVVESIKVNLLQIRPITS